MKKTVLIIAILNSYNFTYANGGGGEINTAGYELPVFLIIGVLILFFVIRNKVKEDKTKKEERERLILHSSNAYDYFINPFPRVNYETWKNYRAELRVEIGKLSSQIDSSNNVISNHKNNISALKTSLTGYQNIDDQKAQKITCLTNTITNYEKSIKNNKDKKEAIESFIKKEDERNPSTEAKEYKRKQELKELELKKEEKCRQKKKQRTANTFREGLDILRNEENIFPLLKIIELYPNKSIDFQTEIAKEISKLEKIIENKPIDIDDNNKSMLLELKNLKQTISQTVNNIGLFPFDKGLSPLSKYIQRTQLGKESKLHVNIGEVYHIAEIIDGGWEVERFEDILVKFQSISDQRKVHDLNIADLAAIQVFDKDSITVDQFETLRKTVIANEEMTTELVAFDKALKTSDLPNLGIVSLQEFHKSLKTPSANAEMYWYICEGKALTINPFKTTVKIKAGKKMIAKDPEFIYSRLCYKSGLLAGRKFAEIDRLLDPKEIQKLESEIKREYLLSDLKEERFDKRNLVWTPIFRAIKIDNNALYYSEPLFVSIKQ